jgi:hypothetical protein
VQQVCSERLKEKHAAEAARGGDGGETPEGISSAKKGAKEFSLSLATEKEFSMTMATGSERQAKACCGLPEHVRRRRHLPRQGVLFLGKGLEKCLLHSVSEFLCLLGGGQGNALFRDARIGERKHGNLLAKMGMSQRSRSGFRCSVSVSRN